MTKRWSVASDHLALVGPTASGKSELALEIASRLGDVEIVSVDAMQVYRGLDIGTAKPTAEDRARVAHHMIDVADADEEWSVARFQSAARAAVADIASRGRRALLVGGTGLYVQAVVDDLRFPATDAGVRADLEAQVATPDGLGAAYAELRAGDPAAAARTEPGNARRIVRALEVLRSTGETFSGSGDGVAGFGPTVFPVRMVGVWLPRDRVSARIAARVTAMIDGGLVREVEQVGSGRGLSRTAAQAIGYREVAEHLAARITLDDARQAMVRRTRALARRQRMWFRRDPRITWHATPDNPCTLMPTILGCWRR